MGIADIILLNIVTDTKGIQKHRQHIKEQYNEIAPNPCRAKYFQYLLNPGLKAKLIGRL